MPSVRERRGGAATAGAVSVPGIGRAVSIPSSSRWTRPRCTAYATSSTMPATMAISGDDAGGAPAGEGRDAGGTWSRSPIVRPRGARARMPPAIDEGGTRGGPGRDRHLRGLGVLLPARGRPGGEDRHPVRPAVGLVLPRDRRRPPGRVPAAPRPPPHDPAPQGQLPGQRLGDALAGRQGRHQPVRRGLAPAPRGARPLRRGGPVRGPHQRARRHLLRRPDRLARLLGRDLRPHAAGHRPRRDPRARHHRPRRRHGGRHQRPALLHQGRRASGSATPGGRSST